MPTDAAFCSKCGSQLAPDAALCFKCGAPVVVQQPAAPISQPPPSGPTARNLLMFGGLLLLVILGLTAFERYRVYGAVAKRIEQIQLPSGSSGHRVTFDAGVETGIMSVTWSDASGTQQDPSTRNPWSRGLSSP